MAFTKQQLGLSFKLPSTYILTNEDSAHPGSNLGLPTKWRRTTRSTTTGAWTVVFDFGAVVPLDGVWLHNVNFGAALWAKSNDNSTYTNMSAAPQSTLFDVRCEPPKRRKTWFPATGWTSSFNNRYLRLTPSSLDAGAQFWEVGAAVFPVIESMVRNWSSPFNYTPMEMVERLGYGGGGDAAGSEVNVYGPTLLRFELQGGPWANDTLAQLNRLRALGQDGAFFLFENNGDNSQASLLKRVADPTFSRRPAFYDLPFDFVETV